MRSSHHLHHERRHFGFSYPVSLALRFYSIVLGPLIVVLLMYVAVRFFSHGESVTDAISLGELMAATGFTLTRLIIAYLLAVIVAVPLALLATSSSIFEIIFLPLFDVMESIPILAFFPVIVLAFVRFDYLNGAAIFMFFLTMLWCLVFTIIGGLKVIPKDITDASQVFKITGYRYFRKVVLPAIFPQFVTGSILAFAQGWNLTIVAEVLHVYIPNGTQAGDLKGLGSLLVAAAAGSQTTVFILAIIAMVLTIAFFNFFIWQKLLHYAKRYQFE